MNTHTIISYEDRCKARSAAARARCFGKPKVINVIDEVKQATAARQAQHNAYRRNPAARDAKARELYERGVTIARISAEIGIGEKVLARLRKRENWPDRPRPRKAAEE